jgi:hypothetical protein
MRHLAPMFFSRALFQYYARKGRRQPPKDCLVLIFGSTSPRLSCNLPKIIRQSSGVPPQDCFATSQRLFCNLREYLPKIVLQPPKDYSSIFGSTSPRSFRNLPKIILQSSGVPPQDCFATSQRLFCNLREYLPKIASQPPKDYSVIFGSTSPRLFRNLFLVTRL